jgi:hypothetical protein
MILFSTMPLSAQITKLRAAFAPKPEPRKPGVVGRLHGLNRPASGAAYSEDINPEWYRIYEPTWRNGR